MNEVQVFNQKNLTKSKGIVNRAFSNNIPTYLTKEEVEDYLSIIKNKRDWLFVYFIWTTGARVSEVLNIKREDIDFEYKNVKIKWLKKRKQLNRIIPLHQNTIYHLNLYCASFNKEDKIFPFSRVRAYQILQKYVKLSKINKKISPHTFRHSYAVYFLKQTKNIVALQKLLGHSNISTTMVYLNIVKSDLEQEINLLEF